MRFLIRLGESATVAQRLVSEVRAAPATEFWPDGPSYADVDLTGVIGDRQVIDVYLAAVAAAHGGRLVTLDESLARLRPADTVLIGAA